MKQPSVTQAYAMIRLLKKRAAKGDALKIQELQNLIQAEKDKKAQIDLETFFPPK